MLHDEQVFPDPETYDPERFLKDGVLRKDIEVDPESMATFGFGRRFVVKSYSLHGEMNTCY